MEENFLNEKINQSAFLNERLDVSAFNKREIEKKGIEKKVEQNFSLFYFSCNKTYHESLTSFFSPLNKKKAKSSIFLLDPDIKVKTDPLSSSLCN